jgi:serine/threonine protein kinase
MKGAATIEAKDLLNRMMQPDPFNRITIAEIKAHPWFNQNICKYLLSPNLGMKASNARNNLDDQIVDKLFTLKLDLKPEDRPQIEAAIKKGELYDF